jgi:hypothetical protein
MRALKFWSIALSAGLLIGLPLGWHLGSVITKGLFVLGENMASDGYNSLTLLQYDQADTEHARQALLGFADFSTSMTKLPSAQGDKALLIEAGRNYLRLAALDELAGNPTLSHQDVLHAQESFRSMGRDIPEEKLTENVKKIAALARPNIPPS